MSDRQCMPPHTESHFIVFGVGAVRRRFVTQQVPQTEAVTPLERFNGAVRGRGGGGLWHLLNEESMTNSVYAKQTTEMTF